MSVKEICDALESEHTKVAFVLGAAAYNDATDRGAKHLTVEAIEDLNDTELRALVVFIAELIAAEPGQLPEEWEVAFQAVNEVLRSRSIVRNCVANARLEGLSCDEDDVAAIQRIIAGATTLDAELDAVIEQYQEQEGE